jgi:predicted Ser/Thr protein kinase
VDALFERRILHLARERGLVSAADISAVEEQAERERAQGSAGGGHPRWSRVIELLMESRKLSRPDLEALMGEIRGEPTTVIPPFDTASSAYSAGEVSVPAWDPTGEAVTPAEWQRFTDLVPVGEGGMGKVYRAYDPRLQRQVALKFLRSNDPAVVEQLLREARAQARVEHDAVCKIYEVGEAGSRPFIAMQYIQGSTLGALASSLSIPEKVKVVARVARALQAAHTCGLVHRDMKPSNVMVERTPDGQLHPFVMDFGLARELSGDGRTVTGTVMGTPTYMAPEQARGDVRAIDARTDVYAAGATLYEALAGAPPFEGTIGEVLVQVLQAEAPPLRRRLPRVPPDLAAIVHTCLDKDPAKRYPSALALAEDLERFLAGEPVRARAPSLWYVARKRAAKHRLAVSLAVVAALAVAVGSTVAIASLVRSRHQAELSQRLAQESVKLEEMIRLAVSRPLHDIRPELARVRKRLQGIADEAARAGAVGEGPGHYALARGFLALGEYRSAEEHLQAAWKAGYRTPEVAYALGLALANRYQRELEAAHQLGDESTRKARVAALDEQYRRPTLAYLARGRSVEVQSPAYVEALVALVEKRYDQAVARAKEAQESIPWLYQASRLEGDVHVARARDLYDRGSFAASGEELGEAAAAYSRAVTQAPSDPTGYTGLCETSNLAVLARSEQGLPAKDAFDTAVKACDAALEADPEDPPAHRARALAFLQWAQQRARHGEDPEEELNQAARTAEELLQLRPDDAAGQTDLGIATRLRAEFLAARGGDPTELLDRAATHLRRALELEPASYLAANNLGLARFSAGFYAYDRGNDPTPAMGEAIATFEKLLAIRPDAVAAMDNMGVALWLVGHWQLATGADPDASLSRAAEVLQRALTVNSSDGVALNNLGLVAAEQATFAMLRGEDPGGAIERGEQACRKAIAINASDPFAYTNLGELLRLRARWQLERGQSPEETAGEALRVLRRAHEVNPSDAEAHLAEGMVELTAARWAMRGSASPAPAFARSDRALARALKINPSYSDALREWARLAWWRAAWRQERGGTGRGDIAAGLARLESGPLRADARAVQGALYLLRARAGSGPQRADDARLAVAALQAALGEDPWLSREYGPLLAQAEALLR